jgi:hypothetical protein
MKYVEISNLKLKVIPEIKCKTLVIDKSQTKFDFGKNIENIEIEE